MNYTGKRVCLSNRQGLADVVMGAGSCRVVKWLKLMFHDPADWSIGRKKTKYLFLRPVLMKKIKNLTKSQVVKA